MNQMDILLILAIAVVCGAGAQLTSKYSKGGWIVHIGVGLLGAFAGVAVARSVNVPLVYVLKGEGIDFPVIWALLGSVFFLAALGFFVKPSRR
jgi:uncharacterized membrane protein YeaQ/YmgE (transglycosylase-associated protein family)